MLKKIIKRPVTVIMVIVAIVLFGIFSVSGMNVDLLPNMQIPILAVTTVYPGANAQTVEKDITTPLEDSMSTVAGVDSVTTYSYDNLSTVLLNFAFGSDLDKKTEEVRQKLQAAGLPSLAQTPMISKVDLNATPVATLAVTSAGADADAALTQATVQAQKFANKISGVGGVGSVSLKGTRETYIKITPKTGTEMLSTLAIVQALSGASAEIPLGTIMEDGNAVSIRSVTEAASIADIGNIPIQNPLYTEANLQPKYVSLRIFASVEKAVSYPNGKSSHNGSPCVVLEVVKAVDGNSSNVVKDIKSEMAAFSDEGTQVALLDDQSVLINDSIGNVLSSLIIGGVLAIVILFLFLKNVKSSLIIALTMPLSVFTAIICLFLSGVTLNMVSLGGLAIGIGMLVDNSIVVIESITRRRERGENAFDSAWQGTKSVAGSIIASTLTTVCVFFPIMFTSGLTKEIFTDLSLSVIFSLSFSLIMALTVIPTLYVLVNKLRAKKAAALLQTSGELPCQAAPNGLYADKSICAGAQEGGAVCAVESDRIKPKKVKKPKPEGWQPLMARAECGYSRILNAVLGKKLIVCLVAFALFAGSIALVFTTGTEFLPSIDNGVIEVSISKQNATLEDIETATKQAVEKIDGGVSYIDSLSYTVGKNGIIAVSDTGKISIKLSEKRKGKTEDVVENIRKLTAQIDADIDVKQIDGVVATVTSGVSGLGVSITGDSEETLAEISEKIKDKLAESDGLKNVKDNLSAKTVEYLVKVDFYKCMSFGFDTSYYTSIMQTLRVGLSGLTASQAQIDGQKMDVTVGFGSGVIDGFDKLSSLTIGTSPQSTRPQNAVLLSDIASVTKSTRISSISKENGKLVLSITAQNYNIDVGTAGKLFSAACDEVLASYPGYNYSASGVQSYLSDAFSGLVVALIISLFLLYAIMAAQFESLRKPLVIMFSIPFSFTGGFLALTLTGTSLNVVSFIGIIMLIGVIVNNAIVMLDKIAELKKEGMEHYRAVLEGTSTRLRPILMTTLTTVLALVPLALGLGKGGELMQPMAIVVIGGLILGTLVTMLLIPAVYCAIFRVKRTPLTPKPGGGTEGGAGPLDASQTAPALIQETPETVLKTSMTAPDTVIDPPCKPTAENVKNPRKRAAETSTQQKT